MAAGSGITEASGTAEDAGARPSGGVPAFAWPSAGDALCEPAGVGGTPSADCGAAHPAAPISTALSRNPARAAVVVVLMGVIPTGKGGWVREPDGVSGPLPAGAGSGEAGGAPGKEPPASETRRNYLVVRSASWRRATVPPARSNRTTPPATAAMV